MDWINYFIGIRMVKNARKRNHNGCWLSHYDYRFDYALVEQVISTFRYNAELIDKVKKSAKMLNLRTFRAGDRTRTDDLLITNQFFGSVTYYIIII